MRSLENVFSSTGNKVLDSQAMNGWVPDSFSGVSVVHPSCLEKSHEAVMLTAGASPHSEQKAPTLEVLGQPLTQSRGHPPLRWFTGLTPSWDLVLTPRAKSRISQQIDWVYQMAIWDSSSAEDTHQGLTFLRLHNSCQEAILPQLLNIWCKRFFSPVKSTHFKFKYFFVQRDKRKDNKHISPNTGSV